ncbi:hypothetical protein HYH02_013434 [Chlamydomonas schloesseri]|uniref:Uncharacterized protein n=1 Tax=Chlamydomonas schloesseri TaxID=2026947 RepID=A0A835SQE5_9CHLO|nr:hypothetical protein HYH02_013434 [Chlamydomonas schloesseri]|eukprot:KAG2431303.1 hypothetical protein HYH02_013434 [Chlamydomonas schloesseri]
MNSPAGLAAAKGAGPPAPRAGSGPAPSPGRSLDAALAGTLGGSLLGLLALPAPPASQARRARKNVSFSLRTRGPGPAYSSPDQSRASSRASDSLGRRTPSAERLRPAQRAAQTSAAVLEGGQSAALVQGLFRAVRRLPPTGSPEPVPSAYPGLQPQPRGGGGGGGGDSSTAGQRRHSLEGCATALLHGRGTSPDDWMTGGDAAASGSAAGAEAAAAGVASEGASRLYLGGPAVDALAAARVHLAMGCASGLDPAAVAVAAGPHTYVARASPQRAGILATGVYGSPGAGRGVWASPTRVGAYTGAGAADGAPPPAPAPAVEAEAAAGAPMQQGSGLASLQCADTSQPHAAHPQLAATQPTSGAAAAPSSCMPWAPSSTLGGSNARLQGVMQAGDSNGEPPASPVISAAAGPYSPLSVRHGSTQQAQPAPAPVQTAPAPAPAATFEQVHRMLASLAMPAAAAATSAQMAAEVTGGTSNGVGHAQGVCTGGAPPVLLPAAAAVPQPFHEAKELWQGARGAEAWTAAGMPTGGQASVLVIPYPAALPGWYFDAVIQQSLDTHAGGQLRPVPVEAFTSAWASASAAWLQSVGRATAAEWEAQREAVREVAAQLAEAVRERRHVEAYLEATASAAVGPVSEPRPGDNGGSGGSGAANSGGISEERLARLHALATASGAPPAVTLALLAELEGRLRLKAALTALCAAGAAAAHREELLESREARGGPLAAAAWRCWWRAARWRLALRTRVQAAATRRRKMLATRVLLGWCGLVARRRDLSQRLATLTARFDRQRLAARFQAWSQLCQRHTELRSILAACRAAAARRALARWRANAARSAQSARQRAVAERHYRRRLLLAALAHWRYLHVARSLGRVWEAALEKRHALALAGRALRVWHFYARRCRQLIQQLSSQSAAAAASSGAAPMVVAEAALPAPLQLAALPDIQSALLAAARSFMLDMSDELLHLRAFLHFTRPAPKPSGQDAGTAAAPGLQEGEGGAAAVQRGTPGSGDGGGGVRTSLPARMSVALGWAGITDAELGGGNDQQQAEGADSDSAASPRLLISGQWRHKQAVLLLLAQLQQVERMAAEVDGQLQAADRAGREARARLQERSEELQRRADGSRAVLEAAHAEQQQLQAALEELDREAQAVVGYLSRCRAASDAARTRCADQVRVVEQQLAEAEDIHGQALAALQAAVRREQEQRAALHVLEQALQPELEAEAARVEAEAVRVEAEAARAEAEAQQRQAQAVAQAAAAAAALAASTAALEAAREGERAGRERLLAAQRRLSEALGLKSALMAHLRQVQAEAAAAPRYAAQRHALRVGEAQSQVVEAAKVVSMAEFEVQELLTAVEKLSTTTGAAEASAAQAHATAAATAAAAAAAAAAPPLPPPQPQPLASPGSAAAAAVARVTAAAEQLTAASQAAAEAAELERGAQEAVSMLQARLHGLRQALHGEVAFGGGDLTAATASATAEIVEVQEAAVAASAAAAAAAVEQQQAVLLEPLVARQRAIGAELEAVRARAEAALAELRTVLAAVAEIPPAVEAAEVAHRAQLLSLQPSAAKLEQSRAQLRGRLATYPGELVRTLGRVVEAYGVEACQDANGEWQVRSLPPQWQRRLLRPGRLAAAGCASDDDSSLALTSSPVAWGRRRHAASPQQAAPGARSTTADRGGGGGIRATGVEKGRRSPSRHPHSASHGHGLGSMSAAQLARMARSALAASAARAPEARTDCSPLRSACRHTGSGTDGAGAGLGALPGGMQYPGSEGRGQRRGHKRAAWPYGDGARRSASSDSGEGGGSGQEGPARTAKSPASAPAVAAAVAVADGQGSSWRQQKKVARVLGFAAASASHEGPLLPPLPPAAPISPRGVFARVVGNREDNQDQQRGGVSPYTGPSSSAAGDSAADRNWTAPADSGTPASFGGWAAQEQEPQPRASAAATTGPAPWLGETGAALGPPAADVAAPGHLNCEAPTAGVVAGPRAAGGDGGAAAVGGLVARSVEDAACLFYLRKLSHKAFQSLRSYAASLHALAAALERAADTARLRRALGLLRQAVAEPQRRAAAFAAAAVTFRAWAAWRLFVQAQQQEAVLVALMRAAARDRLLRRMLRWWNAWRLRREAKLRADTDARDQHRRWLLLRWRAGLRATQHSRQRKAAAADVYRRSLLRRCLRHWRHVLRARRLLHRVFSTAELLWEEYTDTLQTLGAEYCALRHAFDQLRRYQQHRAAKRVQRINEQAAVVFRESLLRVRAFNAWTAMVAAVWQQRYVTRLAVRLLRAWRRHVHTQQKDPSSLCSLRTRLRARGIAGERGVRRRWLQRCALAVLAAPFAEPRRHYRWSLARRALQALWELPERRAQLAVEYRRRQLYGPLRLAVLRQWREATERRAHIRKATTLAAAWRKRRVQHLVLAAWLAWLHASRTKRHLASTASLHCERRVQSRALLAWARLRAHRSELAVSHDAARRLRRCVAGWYGLAARERSKREALIATMAELDGGDGLTAQPRRHRHLEVYEQEQRACQQLLQQLQMPPCQQAPLTGAPQQQLHPELVTGVLSPRQQQQRRGQQSGGAKPTARVNFLPTPASGSSFGSAGSRPPWMQGVASGMAGQVVGGPPPAARRAAGASAVTAAPGARRSAPGLNLDWQKHGRALAPLNRLNGAGAKEPACSDHSAFGAAASSFTACEAPSTSQVASIHIAAAARGCGRPAEVLLMQPGRQPQQPSASVNIRSSHEVLSAMDSSCHASDVHVQYAAEDEGTPAARLAGARLPWCDADSWAGDKSTWPLESMLGSTDGGGYARDDNRHGVLQTESSSSTPLIDPLELLACRSEASALCSSADSGTSASFGGWAAQEQEPQPRASAAATTGPAPWLGETGAALGPPAADVAAPGHLNCEAPTAGVVAGPRAAGGDGGAAAVGGLVARSVEDAACLFYLRKLSHKAFQSLRSYAASLHALAAALERAADTARLRRALGLLRQAVVEPQRRAAAFAAAAVTFRAWAAWRLFVQAQQQEAVLVALMRAAARDRLLWRMLRWWNAWRLRREAKLRADTDARDQHRRWLLLRWRAGLRATQHSRQRKAAATDVYRRSLLRRCLRHWRHVLRARRLLHRVFSTAELLWEEYTDTLQTLGAEYCALRHAFDQLRRYQQHRAAKRVQRINEHAAVVFRESLLRVRAFNAWTAMVAAVWQQRYVTRLAVRLLRAWRRHVHTQQKDPSSLCSLRTRLRACGIAGERGVRRRWLQRCALAVLAAPFAEPRRHYRWSLARRALQALWELPERRAQLAEEYRRRQLYGPLRLAVLRQWREATERRAHIRKATTLAAAWRKRRVQHLVLAAWLAWLHASRTKRHLASTASLHYERRVQSRALLAWARLRAHRSELAVSHDAARRLRRCVAGWYGLAARERSKREALIATMAELDGGAGLTAQPRRHRHLEVYEQEQRACQQLLQQLQMPPCQQAPLTGAPQQQLHPELVTGVLSPRQQQQRRGQQSGGAKPAVRVNFLPTPASGSSPGSAGSCPPWTQGVASGMAGQVVGRPPPAARRAAGASAVTAAPGARRSAPGLNLDWQKHGRALAPLNRLNGAGAKEPACSDHSAFGATASSFTACEAPSTSQVASIHITAAARGCGRPAEVLLMQPGRQPQQPSASINICSSQEALSAMDSSCHASDVHVQHAAEDEGTQAARLAGARLPWQALWMGYPTVPLQGCCRQA